MREQMRTCEESPCLVVEADEEVEDMDTGKDTLEDREETDHSVMMETRRGQETRSRSPRRSRAAAEGMWTQRTRPRDPGEGVLPGEWPAAPILQ